MIVGLKPCNFIKMRLQHMCFSVNIAKFIRTPILKDIYGLFLIYNINQLTGFYMMTKA